MTRRTLPLLVSALGSLSLASPVAAAPRLDMPGAVSLALARAPEILAAQQEAIAASHRERQAFSAYLPRLGLNASYLAWWPKNELPIDLSQLSALGKLAPQIGEIDDYHHVRAGLEVGLRLLDLGRGPRLDASRLAQTAATAGADEARAALALQVRATFLAALYARDVRRIADESLRVARAQEKQASVRAEVGTGSQLALAQARVRVAQLEAQQRQSASELSRYLRLLASLVGATELPELEGDLETLARAPLPRPELGTTPALKRLRLSSEAARASAVSSERSLIPTLDLVAKAEVEYPHVMKTEWGPLFQGALRLSWPFYEGGQRWAEAREARAKSDGLDAAARATRERLGRQLVDLDARARTAEADLASARSTLEQNSVYLRVARAAVAAGTGTELDVHQAELGLDQARVAITRALLNLALVRAEALMVHGVAYESARGGKQ